MPQQRDDKAPLPQFDIDAERAALSACFLSRKAITTSQELLFPRDFFRSSHRKIFEALCTIDRSLNGTGEEISLLALRDELERQGCLDEIGGASYLAELSDVSPTAANISYHASRIHEIALIRNQGIIGYELEKRSHEVGITAADLRAFVNKAYAELDEKPYPSWAFWHNIQEKNRTYIEYDTIQYLDFLSQKLPYRTFLKRGTVCIVAETAYGFEYCTQRNSQIVSLKQEVLDFLKMEGFYKVAADLMQKPKFFSLDILENLPEISKEKVQQSIFSCGKTLINLQDEITNEEGFMYYQQPGESPRELIYKHDIGILVARQGVGKTNSLEMLLSEALMPGCEPECPFHFRLAEDEIIVMFATEKKEDDHKRFLRRIAKRTHPRINGLLNEAGEFKQLLFYLVADVTEDMGFWILEKIESIKAKIGLVVLDTLLDTTVDMNSQELAVRFFLDIKNALRVRNAAFLGTVHAAASSKDSEGKAMGHLGSLFMRKNTMLLQIRNAEEDPSIKILSSDFRNAKAGNTKDYGIFSAFQFDEDDNLFHFIDYTPPEPDTKSAKKASDVLKNFKTVLQDKALTKDKLRQAYRQICECSDKSFYRDFKQAQKLGIVRNVNGYISISHEKL